MAAQQTRDRLQARLDSESLGGRTILQAGYFDSVKKWTELPLDFVTMVARVEGYRVGRSAKENKREQ